MGLGRFLNKYFERIRATPFHFDSALASLSSSFISSFSSSFSSFFSFFAVVGEGGGFAALRFLEKGEVEFEAEVEGREEGEDGQEGEFFKTRKGFLRETFLPCK